ncbi:MAG: non-ribosomal peptide synthetase, partial [bacterium]|nr:non-ribosomal peptide synthetase [bacterium]
PLYNIPGMLDLQGTLDPALLAAALGEIVRRHEVLRTTFAVAGGDEEPSICPPPGEPVQVIHPAAARALPLVDLTALPAAARQPTAEALAQAEARRPFDLVRGPLLRTVLLRHSGAAERAHHALLFNVHHVVFDGWSTGVFLHELTALCRALAAGDPSPLPELGVQYADFAVWQRRWLRGEVLERQLGYWRRQLADLPVLELATDRPRPALQTNRGAFESFRFEAALGRDVHRLAQAHGLTHFMALLAAFTALLGRWSGQREVAVGSPVANRNYREIEPLLGFFVNTLVLRGSLGGDPTVGELLARVRETALAAYAHQDVPFEKLVEELAPERNLDRSPLAQVFFQHGTATAAPDELLPGVELRAATVDPGVAKLDLSLDLEEGTDGFLGHFEYNTDLFDATTIRRMIRQYGNLLAALAADSERRVWELPLLSEG